MERRIPWFWIVLGALLLLAPGPAGHLLLDLLGGLTLVIVFLPFLLAGGGWVAWRILSSRVRTCSNCGLTTMAVEQCPACGACLDLHGPSARTSDRQSQAAVDTGLRRSPFPGSLFNRSLFIQIDSEPRMGGGNRHDGSDPEPRDVTIEVAARPINDSAPAD